MGNSYQPAQGVPVDSLEAKVYLLGVGQAPIQEMEIWQLCFWLMTKVLIVNWVNKLINIESGI